MPASNSSVSIRQLRTGEPLADDEKSNILWTAGNVAQKAGLLDRTLVLASQKAELDQSRGVAREVALAWGLKADVYQARGQWDEALRIRQEEELPVYERLRSARDLLVCRAKIGLNYLARGATGDREKALTLLRLALQDAQRLQLPEAQQIAGIIQRAEHPPESG